jgi:hypothetical protein
MSKQVFKAVRNGVQTVAVKIFTDQVLNDNPARYAEAFRREIFILRSCHDRNIVQFMGACLRVSILPQTYLPSLGCPSISVAVFVAALATS